MISRFLLVLLLELLPLATPTPSLRGLQEQQFADTNNNDAHTIRSLGDNDPVQTRIVGGKPAEEDVPYFVQTEMGCAATLIHDDMLLTAAHCDNGDWLNRRVWIGSKDLRRGLQRIIIDRSIHPGYYGFGAVKNDFMLLKLSDSAFVEVEGDEDDPRPHVETIALNRQEKNPSPEQSLVTMGFGATDDSNGASVDHLRVVEVDAVDNAICQQKYLTLGHHLDPQIMLCAGDIQAGGVGEYYCTAVLVVLVVYFDVSLTLVAPHSLTYPIYRRLPGRQWWSLDGPRYQHPSWNRLVGFRMRMAAVSWRL